MTFSYEGAGKQNWAHPDFTFLINNANLLFVIDFFFETGSHYIAMAIPNLLCRPSCPWTHRDPSASASRVIGLKEGATSHPALLISYCLVLAVVTKKLRIKRVAQCCYELW